MAFRKSTKSAGDCACVEVATGSDVIAVRDSKLTRSPILTFTPDSWSAFITDLREGRLR